ncbi:immunity 49 family protein [Hahella sp. CR1]|uniref:immunity 49 family protein n=1 Tax=Hahella sp. CR1 TaxID=2992807 RepID=UPI00244134CB|nr:immunity 49 family protein [Hahella sp. CR1]MDG9670847.1 immunity 49 family protein [Hahella sp. CR1]
MIKNSSRGLMGDEWAQRDIDRADKLLNVAKSNLFRMSDNVLNLATDCLRKTRLATLLVNNEVHEAEGAADIQLAAKAFAAYFQLAQHPEVDQTILLPGCSQVVHNGVGIIENGRVFPERWQEAYYTAVVARDKVSMDSLAAFPIDILRSSATKSIEAEYVLVEVLQSLHFKRDTFIPLINKASELAVADGSDKALDITMGKIELLLALATNLGLDFNETLEKNLVSHIGFYEAHQEDDVAPVESYIPMELLGMAVQWFDAGNDLTVESDYLPKYCIEGTLFGV